MPVRLLTQAQEDVARLAATGLSDEELAAALGLTAAAVSAHLSQAFRKLGARSRAELPTLLPPRRETKDGQSDWEE